MRQIHAVVVALALGGCDAEADSSRGSEQTPAPSDDGAKEDDPDGTGACFAPRPGFGPGLCQLVFDPGSQAEIQQSDGTWLSLAGQKFCTGTAVETTEGWALMTAEHCDPAALIGSIDAAKQAGFAPPAADDGMVWSDIAVVCADGGYYKVKDTLNADPSRATERWQACPGGTDVALLHMENQGPLGIVNPQLFAVLDAPLREGAAPMAMNLNSVACASLVAPLFCEFNYAAMHFRDGLVCPSGYSAGEGGTVGWQGIGVNSTFGDSGSGLIDLQEAGAGGTAPLAGVIVSTQDAVKDLPHLFGIGDGMMPWFDLTGVVPGNVVHGCFPEYSALWGAQ